jgi:hypothetical protein
MHARLHQVWLSDGQWAPLWNDVSRPSSTALYWTALAASLAQPTLRWPGAIHAIRSFTLRGVIDQGRTMLCVLSARTHARTHPHLLS